MSLDVVARTVLAQYPVARSGPSPLSLVIHGGFSGARLWCVHNWTGLLCLRAWPCPGPSRGRLEAIHGWMQTAAAAGLSWVPGVFRNHAGQTWTEWDGRLWDLTAWMPGRADFHDHPTQARLQAACTALAQLHAVWSAQAYPPAPCPAVLQRLACTRDWQALLASGWQPTLVRSEDDPVAAPAREAWQLVQKHVPRLEQQLAPWLAAPVPLQPCLCDVWHDHVLFEGEAVTGIVDYGSMKVSHVAADLARLLGSLVADDRDQRQVGLAAYRRLRPLSTEEELLVELIDRTGTVLALVNWLRWLYRDERHFDDRVAVAKRLAGTVRRVATWEG